MTDKVRLSIIDPVNDKTISAELPADAPMRRLIPALVHKLEIPGGASYALQHVESGDLLEPDETFASAGIDEDDTVSLIPKLITEEGSLPNSDQAAVNGFAPNRSTSASDAAISILLQRFEMRESQNQRLREELEQERRKTSHRLIAVILLLFSQLAVIPYGLVMINGGNEPLAILLLMGGAMLILLALYLNFWHR